MRSFRYMIVVFLLFLAVSAFPQRQVTLDHPTRHIAGVVQKENGEPLPNIDVEVFGGRSMIANTKTDSHGKFSLSVEDGTYEVWFTYKPHPVFKDVIYKWTVKSKGSKGPVMVTLPAL